MLKTMMPEKQTMLNRNLMSTFDGHIGHLFKVSEEIRMIDDGTYFLLVANCWGFRLVLLKELNQSSMGTPEKEYGPV